jgi:hypothetical protein
VAVVVVMRTAFGGARCSGTVPINELPPGYECVIKCGAFITRWIVLALATEAARARASTRLRRSWSVVMACKSP